MLKQNSGTINHVPATKSRNAQIDTMRFLLILSIFIFHFETAGGKLYRFCGTFHTPGFFLISGFWALNRTDVPLGRFLSNAAKKYLIPWLVWVFVYTVFYCVSNGFGAKDTLLLFVRYFSAVRATGIWGMWFTPAFFLVQLTYRFLTGFVSRFTEDRKNILAWINCIICFAGYFLFRYVLGNPQGLLFSLSFVPEYLFYYALGGAGYFFVKRCSQKMSRNRPRSGWIGIAALLYMTAVYFEKDRMLWVWTEGSVLTFLPEAFTACVALIAVWYIAKFISCDFTARIGRDTLGLCHGEALIKKSIAMAGSLFGLTVQAKTPLEVIFFSLIALAVGTYWVLPVMDGLTQRICAVWLRDT